MGTGLLDKRLLGVALAATLACGWLGVYFLTIENDYQKSIILDESLFQNAPRDPYTFENFKLEGDILTINVQYVGGCREHEFELIGINYFMESDPVQTKVLLSHTANDDPCEALITEELTFSLTPLKETWQQQYQQDSGTIKIGLEGLGDSISYEF